MDFSEYDPTLNEDDLVLQIRELKKRVTGSKFAGSVVPRTDSQFLAKFIRTKDYDLDAAFTSIRKYYCCVQKNQDITTGLTPSKYETAFRSGMIIPLKHSFNGSRTAIFRVKNWFPKEVDLHGVELLSLFVAEQYIGNCLKLQRKGLVVVLDLEGCRFEHVRKLSLKELRRVIHTAQDGIPVRIAGVHFLHPPTLVWASIQIALRLMKEKIRKRVHMHYSYESLHQHLNKEHLPHSVGGDLSEEDAIETHVLDELLVKNPPYEEFWNGNFAQSLPLLDETQSEKIC